MEKKNNPPLEITTEKEEKRSFGSFLKSIFTDRKRFNGSYLIALSSSILLALIVGAVIMLCIGKNPLVAYAEMVKGAFGKPRHFGDTLAKSAVLCITGLAMTIAAKAGVFNVGGEGQLFMGAICSAIVGVKLGALPAVIVLPVSFLAAALAGAAYAFPPAILKTKLGISEVITTILLNSAAIFFCSYLATGPFKGQGVTEGTERLANGLKFPSLIKSSQLTGSIFAVAVIALLTWYFLSNTSGGYEYNMTGLNSEFARYSGLKDKRIAVVSMLLSGAMCGVCGMFLVYADVRFKTGLCSGLYFDGMLVAMIMRYNPIGIVFMSIFFGMMKIGATQMQTSTGISAELILVLQSIIIFFMAAENGITEWLTQRRKIRELRKGGMQNV